MEKVSCFPNEGTPVVLTGEIVEGDIVRVGGNYFRYKAPRAPVTPPDAASFKATIRAKASRLSKAGKYLESISLLKKIGE